MSSSGFSLTFSSISTCCAYTVGQSQSGVLGLFIALVHGAWRLSLTCVRALGVSKVYSCLPSADSCAWPSSAPYFYFHGVEEARRGTYLDIEGCVPWELGA